MKRDVLVLAAFFLCTLLAGTARTSEAQTQNQRFLKGSSQSPFADDKPDKPNGQPKKHSLTTATLSTLFFNFGVNVVNNTVTKPVVVVSNTGSRELALQPTLSGDPSYSIASSTTCGQQLDPHTSCTMVLNYTPTKPTASNAHFAVLNLGFVNVKPFNPQAVLLTGTAGVLPAGQVATTDNPQVALYTMTLPFPGSVTINFGTDTSYGTTTWTQSTTTAGGTVSIFVAGMRASTMYHMQAVVTFPNGVTVKDVDHTFTTGPVPSGMQLNATATTTPGMTPQSGLELLNTLDGSPDGLIITDLSGNVLWTYTDPGNIDLNNIEGVKMLPDGNLLMTIGATNGPLGGPQPAGTILEVREVNLAGDTVRSISIPSLNAALATATCAECNVTLQTFHHDVEPLPNGHWLVLANTIMNLSSTTTPALTNEPATAVLGDVIVDLDQNLNPVWAWNEFNHLDPNRHPYLFPDWTHTNAILYSPDDGNILVSIRHQNWVVKVNYNDGAGDGSIIWHLGEGGDFTLAGGTDPTDWQYAQHDPSFFGPNTAGVFSLGLFDNGDDRIFPSDVSCGSSGAPPCLYSTVPVFQIDESAKTATLTFHQILPTTLYSFFGGNTEELGNGDVEYDVCAPAELGGGLGGSEIFEVTQDSAQQTVWTMQVNGTNAYRGFRIPSLYPGVQW